MVRNCRRSGVVLPIAAVLLLGGGLTAPGTASAAPTTTSSGAATTRVTRIHLRARTGTLPTSTVKRGGGGAVNLTEAGKIQRFVGHSNSPRPKVSRTRSGARALTSTNSPSWLPRVAPTELSATRPGAVKGWEGLNELDNQKFNGFNVEPPDQGLCAGDGHVLEMINDVVRVFGTRGKTQRTATLNAFFHEAPTVIPTDPSCVYDRGAKRFFATQLNLQTDAKTGNLTGKNWLDLAVSRTSDPLRGWNIYRINTTDDGTGGTPAHKDCPCIGDYPHLATDAHGVFLTTNEYPFAGTGVFGNGFNGAQIYAVSKAKVMRGTSAVSTVQFENVRVPSISGSRRVGFTLLPAQSVGTGYARENNGTIYFVSSFAAEEARPDDFTGHARDIGTWWIADTASLDRAAPQVRLEERTLASGSYGIPPLSNQKSGPVPLRDCLTVQCVAKLSDPYSPEQEGGLDSSDTRILTAIYANGRVVSALDTALQVSQSVQSGFQWFSIKANGARTTLSTQGYVGVRGGNVIYPAIATDTHGRGYVGVTLAGQNWYPTAAYLTWSTHPGAAVHIAGRGAAPQDGFCEYLAFNCGGTAPAPSIRPRWGDYSAAVWDGKRFFLANEYVAHSCTYAKFAADFTCGGTRTFFGNFSTHIQQLS